MNEQTDYRLVNRKNREIKLRALRHDIIKSDGQTALSMILDAPSPATLIQSFPDQDLYYLMHKIGPDDFVPVLSMATSDQWEYLIDIDTWDNDRIHLPAMTRVFDLLFQADPRRLLRWAITQKPDFFEFYLFKNMAIFIREHDDVPPSDFDDYITLDDKFYFRFPEKPNAPEEGDEADMPVPGDGREAWELIEAMLKALAEMDLSVFHGLLQETSGLLPAETEEEQFRLKTIRLAEKGFLPTHEAIGIYQPTELSALARRPVPLGADQQGLDPDIPLPPQFFTGFLEDDNLFVKAVRLFDDQAGLILESELAALINKIISADKIRLRSKEDLEKAILKACSYLNLGLEVMIGQNATPASAKAVIETHFLETIFRTGSRAGIRLKTRAQKWFATSFPGKHNLPLSFLDETYLGIIGGLLIEYPMFFNGTAKGDLYRNFKTLSDIDSTTSALDQIIALDLVLDHMDVDIRSFSKGVLTYKTLILTLWAKDRLDLEKNLDPIDTKTFRPFFKALFASKETPSKGLPLNDLILFVQETTGIDEADLPAGAVQVMEHLIKELDDEYGKVDPNNIDPRYIPHFLLQ